jgi:peptidoglycan/LPS O-acetylase OafA/YrhL
VRLEDVREVRSRDLDALRGLAALAVVLFHVRVPLWAGWTVITSSPGYSAFDRALAWLSPPMALFGSAVMLFFVVSGFAIHYPNAAAGSTLDVGPYAVRRLLRIYPPYLAAVLLTIVAEHAALALGAVEPSTAAKAAASALMAQNYLSPAGQMVGNPSLWSLPVEIELYLAYPLLLWLWRRSGVATMLGVVGLTSAAAAAALLLGHSWPMSNFAKYWIIWAAGAVLAELARGGRLPRWTGAHTAAVAALPALAVGGRMLRLAVGLEHFLWGAVYVLAVLWVLTHRSLLERLPARCGAAFLWLGKISYSLYLVHFPFLILLGAGWIALFGRKPSSLLVPLAATVATLPVAYVFWRYVERPAQLLARTFAPVRPLPSPAVQAAGI